jgi:predicted dehydrogenase/threonine dehydrogenase-like Zn-dependent dehydrogenase
LKQILQNVRSGMTACRELPDPIAQPRCLLVANVVSLVSAGTERYVVELARKNVLAKARERPDHVKRILRRIREEGLFETARQVGAKLDEPMPLGYSSAGIVLAAGAGVKRFKAGDRVAAAAPHASVVLVGENLCAQIPDGVSFEQAAYASVGAVALEGIRLADAALGCRILVIGLGLIGQIAACLLKASGVSVLGTDLDLGRLDATRALGVVAVGADDVRATAMRLTAGHGVDAVLITAATSSNGPIELAADLCRQKGRIVLVGVAGTELPRPPFFEKELEFTVSHSLGPGRSEPVYEEKAIDYPIGYVRWTAQRNMEAVLETIASGGLPVDKLTTHRFAIDRAADAYDLVISSREPFLGIVLHYDRTAPRKRRLEIQSRPTGSQGLGVGVIGAGNFARFVALPCIQAVPGVRLRGVCSAHGVNAEQLGRKGGFAFASTDPEEILVDPETSAIFVLTRHDIHADLVIRALKAGKHVFVEKPLCITEPELEAIAACVEELGAECPLLMVGFNRRFAPAVAKLRTHFKARSPLAVSYRFAVPELPSGAWPHDPEVGGGRLVGEACHAIDTCAAIVGSVPTRVYAESVSAGPGGESLDDRVFITMRHENGSVSSVAYHAGGDRCGPSERIEVFGGGRTAVVDDWDRIELWSDNRRVTERGRRDRGHSTEIRAFLDACRNGGSWPISWPDLYATTWAAFAAARSLRDGEPVFRKVELPHRSSSGVRTLNLE